jgi:hypothetical protein
MRSRRKLPLTGNFRRGHCGVKISQRGARLLQKYSSSKHSSFHSYLISVLLCLFAVCLNGSGQELKPVVLTTPPRTTTARLSRDENDKNLKVHGKVSFTITTANEDDTVTGTVVFTVAEDVRQKIAELNGSDLKSTPASYSKKDVLAHFRKGTACPVLYLEISKIELELGGVTACLDRISPVINESPEQISLLFCSWARQINTDRHRLGIIAAINRLLSGDPEK